ncbi:doxx family protein [Paracrocinitomix mangrovi]|uniref:doxx family protein n=1 Tax=Paracrocinitomix mangrovi TaxID=2862509 RepID=UPI001C8DDA71|nr:doxx family protein [Paracrocinitomix mangrovi]UKN02902.1 doxx family protein [Paracrocinitomix mangrovi]
MLKLVINKIQSDKNILLSISIGIAYLWFGLLKFFPHLSPAEGVAGETITLLTFHLIPKNVSIILLAIWECAIGICLLVNYRNRFVIYAGIIHILCTFTPLFLMSDACFNKHFYSPSLLGQYIIKNLVIISALIVLLPHKVKKATNS